MGGKSSTPRENPQVVPSDGQNDHPPSQEEGSSSKPSPPAPAQKLQPGPQQNLQSEDPSKYSSSSDSRRALTSCPQPPPLGPNKIVQRPGIEVNKRWPLFHGRLFDLLPPLKNRSIARDGRMTVNLDSQRAQLLTIRIGDRDDRALCIVHARRGEDQHGYHDFQLELQFQPGIGGRFTNVQLEVKLRAPGQPDRPIQFSYFPNSTVSPKETEEGKLQDLDTYIDRSIRGRYREYARPTFSEHMAVQFKRSIRTSSFKLQSSGMSMPLPLGITKNQKRVYLKISRQKWGATVLTLSLIKSICRQLLDTKAAGLSS